MTDKMAKRGSKTQDDVFEKKNKNETPNKVKKDGKSQCTKSVPRMFMEQLAGDVSKNLKMKVPSGCLIQNKYDVLSMIGSGAYGNVYNVKNIEEDRMYAMKVIKSKHAISPSALREIEVLVQLGRIKAEQTKFIVKIKEALTFHHHVCILYELLGPTVYKLLRINKYVGLPMDQVREITRQVVIAADFLHLNGIIHHDIKPDNVAFVYCDFEENTQGVRVMKRSDVKLIDFGSTVNADNNHCSTATTRQYRSPEMGLRYTWCFESDVWCIGCSVFEFYTGHLLFCCEDEKEKCYMIEAVCEQPIPVEMGRASGLPCFNEKGILKYQNVPEADEIQSRVKPLMDYQVDPEDPSTQKLFDLLKQMLKINPVGRISTENILRHAFLTTIDPNSVPSQSSTKSRTPLSKPTKLMRIICENISKQYGEGGV